MCVVWPVSWDQCILELDERARGTVQGFLDALASSDNTWNVFLDGGVWPLYLVLPMLCVQCEDLIPDFSGMDILWT